MKLILFTSFSFFLSVFANANAGIFAKDAEGLKYNIALDSKGTPRTNGNSKTYPTIKDFREGLNYGFYCVKGNDSDVKKLFAALVNAADGDGDSWAKLLGIYKNPKSWAVLVSFTDERGKYSQRLGFPVCRY